MNETEKTETEEIETKEYTKASEADGGTAKKARPAGRSKRASEKDMTFEAAMTRLEAVVRALEDGKTPLEESMKLYEEGISLVRLCSGKLEEADKKVRILTGAETAEG